MPQNGLKLQALEAWADLGLEFGLKTNGGSHSLPGSDRKGMAGTTRLELATSAVTGQRSNQLNYVPADVLLADGGQCPIRTDDLSGVNRML